MTNLKKIGTNVWVWKMLYEFFPIFLRQSWCVTFMKLLVRVEVRNSRRRLDRRL